MEYVISVGIVVVAVLLVAAFINTLTQIKTDHEDQQ